MVDSWAMNHFTRGCLGGGGLSNISTVASAQSTFVREPIVGQSNQRSKTGGHVDIARVRTYGFADGGSPMHMHPVNSHAAPLPRGVSALALAGRCCRRRIDLGLQTRLPVVRDRQGLQAKEFCVAPSASSAATRTTVPPGSACNAGKCDPIPGYCRSKADCPANQECIANRARPARTTRNARAASTASRAPARRRSPARATTTARRTKTASTASAARTRRRRRRPRECTLDAVFFDFNESALTTEATAVLARDAECLKKVGRGA